MLHAEDRERVREEFGRAMRERSDYSGEYRIIRPDGQACWVAARGRFIYRGSQPVRMSAVCWDVTDRKRVEEALRHIEDRRRILSEGVRDCAVFMLDLQGRVNSWNAVAEQITGYRAEEIMGHDYACLYPEDKRDRGKSGQDLETAVAALDGRYEHDGWAGAEG